MLFKLSKSPFSSLRTLEELAEAGGYTFSTISLGLTKSREEFLADPRVVYQKGFRAGQWKINKNWKDAVPLLYAFEKWAKDNQAAVINNPADLKDTDSQLDNLFLINSRFNFFHSFVVSGFVHIFLSSLVLPHP